MDQSDISNPDSLRDFYRSVIAYYGEDAQADAIIEEAAELIHAICKYRQMSRKGEDMEKAREQVIEEIGDMQIALDQAKMIYSGAFEDGEKRFDETKRRKLTKLAEHIRK